MLEQLLRKQPALIRFMVILALLVLPALAWVDARNGCYYSALAELLAAGALFAIYCSLPSLSAAQAARLALIAVFPLACIASFEKLDSLPNLAWFTVMPFLYIAIGGVKLGTFLSVAQGLFTAACYLTVAAATAEKVDAGTWLQVGLAYVTSAGLAISYETMQSHMRARLRALADRDPLTNLLNRRGMEKQLGQLDRLRKRQPIAVTVALLDVDHFKHVNDRYGHDTGDRILVAIGDQLTELFRGSDYLARWGGEEFLIVLTHTTLSEAAPALERLRKRIADTSLSPEQRVTISIGAVSWHADQPPEDAVKNADLALYDAKARGRDRLVVGSADPGETAAGSFATATSQA